jgi:hypothetical protein
VPRMSADRSGALRSDTLTPSPTTKNNGGEPVDRGVAPRSCSPGTPKRGEHTTRPLVDGATRPEGVHVCIEDKVRTALLIDSGEPSPQDRRRTNLGLLQHREQCFQKDRGHPHWAPDHNTGKKPKRYGKHSIHEVRHVQNGYILSGVGYRVLLKETISICSPDTDRWSPPISVWRSG